MLLQSCLGGWTCAAGYGGNATTTCLIDPEHPACEVASTLGSDLLELGLYVSVSRSTSIQGIIAAPATFSVAAAH